MMSQSDGDEPNELTATETAKAAQEVAKTTGKGIDAGRDLGGFIARFIGGPLEQASGIVEDKLKYMRWERQVRLMNKTDKFLREQGLDVPTRTVPMKVAVPLLQAASMEEDDELQDIWARLLVNAANAESGVDVTRAFVSILEDFGPLEAQVLQAIYDVPEDLAPLGQVVTQGLPQTYFDAGHQANQELPPEPVTLALWNLKRLGCIEGTVAWGGPIGLKLANITSLGAALVNACASRRGEPVRRA